MHKESISQNDGRKNKKKTASQLAEAHSYCSREVVFVMKQVIVPQRAADGVCRLRGVTVTHLSAVFEASVV